MKLGHIIKAERLKKDMKQIILAKGICTPSYLSRIELDQVKPSEEIVFLLLQRLGINMNEIIREKDDRNGTLLLELKSLYKEVIIKRDSEFAKKELARINFINAISEDSELYYTFNLIVLRFKLIAGEDLSAIKTDIELLREQKDALNERQKFIFEVNEGILLYKENSIKKAILKFEYALNMDLTLEDWEQAEIHYMLGLAYVSDNRMAASLEYIESAQQYFKSKLLIKRVLDCFTLKGIYYKRINNFKEAEHFYFEAIELCKNFSIPERLGSIYHNLGILYLTNGRIQDGVNYIHECLKSKSDPRSKLTTILSLVITYSKMSNTEQVIHWCEEGLSICENNINDSNTPFLYHFNFYKSLHSKNVLTSAIVNSTITYFVDLEDYRSAQKYAIAFAMELYKKGKYKLSSSYFMDANKYNYSNREIENWEDI
ncbi:tetratricopeptide (TPR) repeat protein [Sporosarcina luteola]|nr:tetratricopeptide (TPR) repeat protein [Sporosarcina luteola]